MVDLELEIIQAIVLNIIKINLEVLNYVQGLFQGQQPLCGLELNIDKGHRFHEHHFTSNLYKATACSCNGASA